MEIAREKAGLGPCTLARIIVCCGASIVAHFARKVRATNT